jgi:hypothetical protein
VETENLVLKDYPLSLEVRLRWATSAFKLTTVYGPTEDADKSVFLDELISLKPPNPTSWIVLGDSNLIYETRDKSNLNINRKNMGKFRHALDGCELSEFALKNRRYTWSNERDNPTLIRLDRVFCNKEWDLTHTGFGLQALSSSLSDHCPLFLCQQDKPQRKESFRFENFWPKILGFLDVVSEAWQEPTPGISSLNVLYYNLRRTAKALKLWNKNLFGKAHLELAIANEIIQKLDVAQEARQLSGDEIQLRKDLKTRVLGLAAAERSRWRQASRLVWLKEGDACTKYFHLKAIRRSRKNFIPCIKKNNGSYVWTHKEKEAELQSHF